MLIDTHCHLDFNAFDDDRESVIESAIENDVEKMVSIGCTADVFEKTIEMTQKFEAVYASLGVHPDEVSESFDQDFLLLEELAQYPKVVALGETGFDFYREENPSYKMQYDSFLRHTELAKKLNKPVIVHLRSADEQALEFFAQHHD